VRRAGLVISNVARTIMMVAVVYRLDWVAVSREAVAKASEKAAGTAEERPLATRGGGDDEE
jgi:hypothetical protein